MEEEIDNEPNYQLENGLYKLIIGKFQKKSLFMFQRQYLGYWLSWYASTE